MRNRLPGFEALESRQLMAADTMEDVSLGADEPTDRVHANQFYLRQDAHGGDAEATGTFWFFDPSNIELV